MWDMCQVIVEEYSRTGMDIRCVFLSHFGRIIRNIHIWTVVTYTYILKISSTLSDRGAVSYERPHQDGGHLLPGQQGGWRPGTLCHQPGPSTVVGALDGLRAVLAGGCGRVTVPPGDGGHGAAHDREGGGGGRRPGATAAVAERESGGHFVLPRGGAKWSRSDRTKTLVLPAWREWK